MATLFVISLTSSVVMIVQTINWMRLKGPGKLPAWLHPATTLSEWVLAISSLGLLMLAIATIVRQYRDKPMV
jgi:hypothetical protein